MRRFSCQGACRLWVVLALTLLVCGEPTAWAQRDPHIGYVYPAGGRSGTELNVTIGGQYLNGALEIQSSGQGIAATIIEHKKPLTQRQANILRDKIDQARKKLQAEGKKVDVRRRRGAMAAFLKALQELEVTEEDLDRFEEYRRRRADEKRQPNPQIEETVSVALTLDATAEPGRYELRLKTPAGLSNPVNFYVGEYPERLETEPNDRAASEAIESPLPAVLNGQIMPGDVDRFRFEAEKGDRLVIAAQARELVPYLADAVPGWFQAVVALYDADGREVAYADDFRFHPDPILYVKIPDDGAYELEIRDSIYRGREDFVYRITLGETPYLTSIFPLGTQQGATATVALRGWNLPSDTMTVEAGDKQPGNYPLSVRHRKYTSNQLPFVIDTLPECLEEEPNDTIEQAHVVIPPLIVNGHMEQPGDWDVFRFDARAGGQVIVEVLARRLNSPLDSLLKLTDAGGRQLMVNDDFEDKGAGLVTHHADSRLLVELPEDGAYYLHVGDAQKKGGPAFGYRLRISARRPDFELRVVPASINARPGATVPLTVYALRRDGFDQDIAISLTDAPGGFEMSGGWVPAAQDKVQLTLTVPTQARAEPYRIELEGRATVRGQEIIHRAVPAEDMMQAFIYRHLVPADELLVYVTGRARIRTALASEQTEPTPENLLKIRAGGMVRYQLAIPNRRNLANISVELSEPPKGISIIRVIRGRGGLVMLISADAERAKPGLKGNLILNVFVQRTIPGKNGRRGTKRRIPVGTFPAVPFEVVSR